MAHTYSEDPLGLATCTHVGVVDLFEHHPGLIVFSHLGHRGGRLGQRQTLLPLYKVCAHRRPRRRLSQTSKKFLCQTLVIILLLELRSMPASALLFRSASGSFQLVHCWQINKPFKYQKSHKIQKTTQECAVPKATGKGRANLKVSD